MRGVTRYSAKFKGSPSNHHFAQRFDLTDGFLGIQQFDGDQATDRVLLNPSQVRELLAFVTTKKRRAVRNAGGARP